MSPTNTKKNQKPAADKNVEKTSKRSLNIDWGAVIEPKAAAAGDQSAAKPPKKAKPASGPDQEKELSQSNRELNEPNFPANSGAASDDSDAAESSRPATVTTSTASSAALSSGTIQSRFAPPSTIDPDALNEVLKNLFESLPLSFEKRVSTVRLPTTIDTFLKVISGELKKINPSFKHVSKEDVVGRSLEVIIADEQIRRLVLIPVIQSLLVK